MKNQPPLALIILDGFGIGQQYAGNAIQLAKMSFYDQLIAHHPHCHLEAAGEAVGLPKGEDGNSEVGHLNLGAGRIVYQDLPRINMSIADASFFHNKAFLNAIAHAKQNKSALHLMGLIGSGGVHSNIEHLFALLHLAKKNALPRVYLHLFTDGRDSPPTSALIYLKQIENEIKNNQIGQISSIVGRYFAMDRDKRWDRTFKAYDLITKGKCFVYKNPEDAILAAYARNETDEFIQPSVITNEKDEFSHSRIKDNDAVIFYNFRIDRPRQLTKMFVLPVFNRESVAKSDYDPYTERYFKKMLVPENGNTPVPERGEPIKNLFFVTMTQYDKNLNCEIAYPLEKIVNPLGEVIAKKNLRQLRLSESEKEKMVTYFFNGYREDPFNGEERIIIASPQVSTYDQEPDMSAPEITETFVQKFQQHHYDFCVANFANPDMLGHTGNIEQTIVGLKIVDSCLEKIYSQVVDAAAGTLLITADHGNCEEMIDRDGNIDTKHSRYPVPLIVVSKNLPSATLINGVLGDVAPTILHLIGIEKPAEMTGRNLIQT